MERERERENRTLLGSTAPPPAPPPVREPEHNRRYPHWQNFKVEFVHRHLFPGRASVHYPGASASHVTLANMGSAGNTSLANAQSTGHRELKALLLQHIYDYYD